MQVLPLHRSGINAVSPQSAPVNPELVIRHSTRALNGKAFFLLWREFLLGQWPGQLLACLAFGVPAAFDHWLYAV